MQIFINSLQNEKGINEWHMIELQGDIESKSNDSMAGKLIGDLHFSKNGVPILIIGHHILHGKVEVLQKPFAVLEKGLTEKGKSEYIVKALIKRRILFNNRPKPLVSHIPKKP